MASASRVMDKQQLQPPSAAPLNCPRCDSSNTKFCYYNNYSLSQPRHFCKACKRYWTRGGTLRNVPVGGGCRKNKRLKTTTTTTVTSTTTATTTPTTQNPRLLHNNISSASNHINSPMFFGLDPIGGGGASVLGFSSSGGLFSHIGGDGFNSSGGNKHIIQDISLNSNQFHHPAISFDRNSHLSGNFETSFFTPMKDAKIDGLTRLCQNQTEQIDLSNFSDPSHYWNSTTATATTTTGNWHDPTNNGSSIASLF